MQQAQRNLPVEVTAGHGELQPARHNLPAQLTSLVGRSKQIAHGVSMLRGEGVRLLTLTGPAGIGKTRLSLEVAKRLLTDKHFTGGVYFVPLASVSTPELVTPAIAQTLHYVTNMSHSK